MAAAAAAAGPVLAGQHLTLIFYFSSTLFSFAVFAVFLLLYLASLPLASPGLLFPLLPPSSFLLVALLQLSLLQLVTQRLCLKS
eukprot:766976-Hanusia_phi.AAC.6